MRLTTPLFLLVLAAAPLAAVTPYQFGSLPSAAADADLTSAYNTWKSRRFKTITCGTAMAYVDNGAGRAFSEGLGYGMLMTAYLDADSTDFAKLERFYEMKRDSHGLMNWNVPEDCSGDNGANAATDGDLDVAIALIRAHRRWPTEGWGAKATTVLNNIYTNMVDGCQGLKNGDTWGGCSSGANNAYNPSYFRTAYFNSFNCFEGGGRWSAVRTRSYNILNTAYSSYALPPDWVKNDGSYGQATNSGGYGYDSCRSPWSLTQDYLWWGNSSGQNWGKKIALVFGNKASWGSPATAAADVGDDYSYSSGAKVRSNHENAFIGGAAVSFMATTFSAQANAFYSNLVFNDNNSYYSDSLKVIYLMILTGAFQEPCYGPGPIPSPTPTATPTNYAGTPTQTPQPAFGLKFEDFESGLTGGYSYTGPTQSRSASAAKNGAYGYLVTGTLAGGGVGFNSTYANGQGVVDATGAVSLRFWVKSDVNISFQVDWYEAGTPSAPVAGGDGEAWLSNAVNVTGGSGWQQIVLPLSSMTEEVYNGVCNPTYGNNTLCATSGNNTQNLSAVNKIQIKFTLGSAATVNFDDFEFVLGTQPSPTFTRTPFIGSYNQVFDDIESPLSLNQSVTPKMAGAYGDTANGATATVGTSSSVLSPAGGGNTTSGMVTYNTGAGAGYGAGAWLLSPYSGPSLSVDASGAVFIGFWLNAPAGLSYRVEFTEAGSPTSPTAGAEGEAWQSGPQIAGGGWEFVQLELGTFTEDIYNPTCVGLTGGCAGTGDGVMDFQAISSVTLKLDSGQGSGTFYFDDVVFVTSYKSPTPTRTGSPTPSVTRTPTPSRTATATVSPSFTPTASPTATPTLSPSGSPTDSPTETPFAGSPTDTPLASDTATPSVTLSSSYTATPSASPTASPSATPTDTPQPGSPTYTVLPSSPTPTWTPGAASATPTWTPGASTATLTPTPTPPATATLTSTPAPTAMIQDLAFSWTPSQLTVTAGTNVTWGWVGTHDVRSDTGLFSSGAPAAGGSFNYTFNTAGTYRYYCSLHGGTGGTGMAGIIYVTGPVATATPSNGGGDGSQVIINTQPFPNPVRNGGSLRVQLLAPVQALAINFYTSAMVKVASLPLGAQSGGWVDIALPASVVGQPAGIYFYSVSATRNGSSMEAPKGGRLILLH